MRPPPATESAGTEHVIDVGYDGARIRMTVLSRNLDLEKLKAEAQRGIELLKERRNALIAAAVTGKIDVRNAA